MSHAGFVAITGRPNAGKSTLLNRVLGAQLSIVTPKAQTTRERVLGILTDEKLSKQIVFVDTPGIHRAKEGGINATMMGEVREGLDGSSAVWYLVDPQSGVEHEQVALELLRKTKAPVFILFNKTDLRAINANPGGLDLFEKELMKAAKDLGIDARGPLRISAHGGEGVASLLDATWKLIPESQFFYPDPDQLSDRPTRFFVAEKIREQLLLQLGQELPYSCAVEIELFDEKATPPRIEAMIYVERDSQKGMVIGKGGSKIKEIGQAARVTIEEFLGSHVFLGLKVKVLKEWSRDADALRRLGYNLPDRRGS